MIGGILGASSALTLFPTAARTATVNGTGVDARGAIGDALVLLDSAAGTGTSPTLVVRLQDSDDNAVWADIAGATFAQVAAVASAQSIRINGTAARRFIRAVATIGGTTPSFTFSVSLLITPQRI